MATELARADSPRGEVVLRSRDDGAVELRVNGVFVMDTLEVGTERALAQLALELHPAPHRVLVAGLGLGFTAREVLADSRVGSLTVVEIEEAVVAWARDGLLPGGTDLLADERLQMRTEDFVDFLGSASRESFDVALLDVDNGPDFLVHDANAALYRPTQLSRLRDLLTPGGVAVIWSSTRSEDLLTALEQVFGAAECRAHPVKLQDRDEVYHLHVGRRVASKL